jgi:hypothetical protein
MKRPKGERATCQHSDQKVEYYQECESPRRKGQDVDVSVGRVIDTSIRASKTVIEGRCASLERKESISRRGFCEETNQQMIKRGG